MKDRQFKIMLGLVVAAGLVMGLIAFRMTGGAPSVATAAVDVKAIGGDPNAPHPSAADAAVETPPESTPLANTQNGEPSPPATEPPEMQGPTNGDPPTVASDMSSATPPSSSDVPPQ